MRIRTSRAVCLLAAVALSAGALGATSGCARSNQERAADDAKLLAKRARQVAAAWDGSSAAAEWRAGYHPMGDVDQLPRGGLRGEAHRLVYRDDQYVLRGEPGEGRVRWADGSSLTRPLVGAAEAYRALTGSGEAGESHRAVTGARLGEMTVATSRGPATVPAWVFTLDGYPSPLKRAAVVPSRLPRPPIRRTSAVPGSALRHLARISADGRSLTVGAFHGACDDGAVVKALETGGSVVLSGSVKGAKGEELCTAQAKLEQITLRLKRPVGDRVLLDAITGRPVPYRPERGPSPSWS